MNRSTARTILGILSFLAILLALALVFLYAPVAGDPTTGRALPEQKIFYFHIASAWNGFLGFFLVLVFSIAYLWKRTRRWDRLASAAMEISWLYFTIVMVTGPIWGRVAWGVWWTWDPRLTTSLVLWLIATAYLLVRALVHQGERASIICAAFGILGAVDVPIVFMSIHWWRTQHPVILTTESVGLTPPMLLAFVTSLIAFTVFFFYLFWVRASLASAEDTVAHLKELARERL
jgi:heme exporter protein C